MSIPLIKDNFTKDQPFVANFVLSFCFLSLYLFFDYLYLGLSTETLRHYYLDYFASFCAFIIDTLSPGQEVKVIQNSIVSSKANLSIVRTCDGSTAFFLITAAILVFRSTIKLTTIGIAAGLMLIILLNTIRIISLYFLMTYNYTWFSYIHTIVAPFLILSICCGYFALWAYYANEIKGD